MTPEEFRRQGRQAIDWIADYLEQVERRPVASPTAPGEVLAQLPEAAPEQGEPLEAVLQDLDRVILPGVTHWQSPRFFGYFPANTSPPSILGELLSAGLGVQGMLWSTSPACTELEIRVLDWLARALALPNTFLSSSAGGGVIQDSASSAGLCALLAARERRTGGESNRLGARRPLVAYASEEAHSSVHKAMMIAGLGSEQLRLIETDQQLRMRPQRLADAVEADLAAGLEPCFVCATVGTTSTGAFDRLREIGRLARRHGLWLHVDAAMFGAAALCPEHRGIHDGLELADSYCVNPHKWLLVNFDCSCLYVADRDSLRRALSVTPEYLRDPAGESRETTDFRDWQIPLGRRFRSLKLWLVLRSYGLESLRQMIRGHIAAAQQLAGQLAAHESFELMAPAPLNLVCFRHRGGDEATRRLLQEVNASGEALLTHTKVDGRFTIRLCVGQRTTEPRHVQQAWRRIQAAAATQ